MGQCASCEDIRKFNHFYLILFAIICCLRDSHNGEYHILISCSVDSNICVVSYSHVFIRLYVHIVLKSVMLRYLSMIPHSSLSLLNIGQIIIFVCVTLMLPPLLLPLLD